MGWFSSSSPTTTTNDAPPSNLAAPTNLASDLKPAGQVEKVKPCCVCKDEKSQRDECMLFSTSDDPQDDCKGLVTKYKECMAGYGFKM